VVAACCRGWISSTYVCVACCLLGWMKATMCSQRVVVANFIFLIIFIYLLLLFMDISSVELSFGLTKGNHERTYGGNGTSHRVYL